MTHRMFVTGFEHALGVLGLFMMLLVARLAETGYAPASGRTAGFLARRAIDSVALVGRLANYLPGPLVR